MKPAPASAAALANSRLPITRAEIGLVVVMFLVGAGLRCAAPARMAVEHFDEGVYASNIWFDAEDGYRYPAQHLFAPPLLPSLIEISMLLLGPSNGSAMLPGLLAGCLIVPLVWWVGREWFGPAAGVSSATLSALCQAHIAFSRTALTDVVLCTWMVLAVYFLWRALLDGDHRWVLAAGLFTALAWWTKYNGWLPLAIGGAAIVPWGGIAWWQGRLPIGRSAPTGNKHLAAGYAGATLKDVTLRWLAVTCIALAAWSPWLWSLQSKGGYSAVAANHRGYLVGLPGWVDACLAQAANLSQLDGVLGQHAPLVALAIAVVLFLLGTGRFTWNTFDRSFYFWSTAGMLAMLVVIFPGWLLSFCFAAYGCALTLRASLDVDRPPANRRQDLAAWMLAAWLISLTLTTPMYTPYPRLTMPWLVAGWLAAGPVFQRFADWLESMAAGVQPMPTGLFDALVARIGLSPASRRRLLAALVVLGVGGVCMMEGFCVHPRSQAWESRRWIQGEATTILETCRSESGATRGGEPFVIYTLAEPALLFQLRLAGAEYVRPIATLALAHADAPPTQARTFVVVGEQARRTTSFEADYQAAQRRLREVYTTCVEVSHIVALDSRESVPAGEGAASGRSSCPYRLTLFEVR